jgi:Leucine-rich repeat (LRR) protein
MEDVKFLTWKEWSFKSTEQLFISNCSIEMVESGLLNILHNISNLDLSWNTKMGFDPIANISVGIANRTQFKRLNLNNVYDYFEANCGVFTVEHLGPLNASHLEHFAFEGNNIVKMNADAVKYIPKTLKYTSLRNNMLMFGKYFGELIKTELLANLVYYDSSQQFHNHIPLNVTSEISVNLLADNKHRFIDSVFTSDCENMFTSYYFKDNFHLIDERLKRFNITPFNTERNPSPFNRIEYLDLSENLPGVIYVALKMFEQAPFIRFLNLSTNYNGIPYLGSQELYLNYSSLRYLDLSSNRIEHIQQDVFKNQKLLHELDLSNNKLAEITFNLRHMSMLRFLSLRNNSLETISLKTTSEIDDLESLRINIV